jgi:Concanavalin A-like lectin/glucanases superfamily
VGAAPPVSGLVAHWSFDEGAGTSAGDSSGNGHAGTLTYGPGWAAPSACKLGGCLSLDGIDDYVRVRDAAQLRLTGDVTVAAWIKPTALGAGKRSLVSKRYEFELGAIHESAPHRLQWSHKDASGTLLSGDLTASTELNQWQHVVLVRSAATRQIRGYKNGSLALTSTYASAPGTSSYSLNIGRNPGGNQHFKGLIDEVRVYDRALGAAEVQAVYGQGTP